VEVETESGDVVLAVKVEGERVTVRSRRGSVVARKVRAGTVALLSSEGDVWVRDTAEGSVQLYGRRVRAGRLLASRAEVAADEGVAIDALYAESGASIRCGEGVARGVPGLRLCSPAVSLGAAHGVISVDVEGASGASGGTSGDTSGGTSGDTSGGRGPDSDVAALVRGVAGQLQLRAQRAGRVVVQFDECRGSSSLRADGALLITTVVPCDIALNLSAPLVDVRPPPPAPSAALARPRRWGARASISWAAADAAQTLAAGDPAAVTRFDYSGPLHSTSGLSNGRLSARAPRDDAVLDSGKISREAMRLQGAFGSADLRDADTHLHAHTTHPHGILLRVLPWLDMIRLRVRDEAVHRGAVHVRAPLATPGFAPPP
jgi:hypothetical protein